MRGTLHVEGIKLINGEEGGSEGGVATVDGTEEGVATFTNCALEGNTARNGGVIKVEKSGSAVFNNCSLSQNTGTGGAGIAYVTGEASSAVFNNCTVSGNTGTYGGAFRIIHQGNIKSYSSIFSGNTASIAGGVATVSGSGSFATFMDCGTFNNQASSTSKGHVFYAIGGASLTIINPQANSQTDAFGGDSSLLVACSSGTAAEVCASSSAQTCTDATSPHQSVVCTYDCSHISVTGASCTACSTDVPSGCTALSSCDTNKFDTNGDATDGCEAGCAAVPDGTCTACNSAVASGCTTVVCNGEKTNADTDATNGCEASNPVSPVPSPSSSSVNNGGSATPSSTSMNTAPSSSVEASTTPSPVPSPSSSSANNAAMYWSIGAGQCSDWKYLPEGAYPDLLQPSQPLYNADRVEECLNRCVDAYPNSIAFFVRTNGKKCACYTGACSGDRVAKSKYHSYRKAEL